VQRLKKAIREAAGEDRVHFFDATATSNALFGNAIGANMFLLGSALQLGGLPLTPATVERAIELNGEAVAMNLAAFRWGRRAAHDPESVRQIVAAAGAGKAEEIVPSLDELIRRRADFLTAYQDAAYAARYRDRIERIRRLEERLKPDSTALTETVTRNLFKLMAIKDEYEVARLYTDGSFKRQLTREFESFDRLEFHLAPPVLGQVGTDGKPRKTSFGPWMMKAFRVLAGLRRLRGTRFDLFGRTAERRLERRVLADYEGDLDHIESLGDASMLEAAIALASVPALIRGYGHVKEAAIRAAGDERARLIARLQEEKVQSQRAA
jgi:indolepyruvate ferredoxin oxidoreductase